MGRRTNVIGSRQDLHGFMVYIYRSKCHKSAFLNLMSDDKSDLEKNPGPATRNKNILRQVQGVFVIPVTFAQYETPQKQSYINQLFF